jgi:DTW domain-containing protein YfiP
VVLKNEIKQKYRKRKPNSPCAKCGINQSLCICDQLHQIDLKTRVDLIIHHRETKRTTNTGQLISSLLSNQKIHVRGLQNKPLDHSNVLDPAYNAILLYPCDEAIPLSLKSVKNLSCEKPLQLIVPDGNWRQASKVHYRVEEFKDLPRVTLKDLIADKDSLLRKESKENGMSTLEAIANALYFIEGAEAHKHLLKAYKIKKNTTLKLRGTKLN